MNLCGDYVRTGGDVLRGQWTVRAWKTKLGDWIVVDYSAIALNHAEIMGRFRKREEAVAFADRVVAANHQA